MAILMLCLTIASKNDYKNQMTDSHEKEQESKAMLLLAQLYGSNVTTRDNRHHVNNNPQVRKISFRCSTVFL